MGKLANGYPIKDDLQKPESLENRFNKEKSFYDLKSQYAIPYRKCPRKYKKIIGITLHKDKNQISSLE